MGISASSMEQLIEKIRHLPNDRITEVEDFVDFLRERVKTSQTLLAERKSLDFPVDQLGQWPEGLGLRREDMYNDDGR